MGTSLGINQLGKIEPDMARTIFDQKVPFESISLNIHRKIGST